MGRRRRRGRWGGVENGWGEDDLEAENGGPEGERFFLFSLAEWRRLDSGDKVSLFLF